MAKNQAKTEIEVISYFDGELDAAEVFASLIVEKYRDMKLPSQIVEHTESVYNQAEVREHHASSGLCG